MDRVFVFSIPAASCDLMLFARISLISADLSRNRW